MADGEINRNGATIRIDDDGGVQVEPAEGQEVEYTGPDRGTDAIRDSVNTEGQQITSTSPVLIGNNGWEWGFDGSDPDERLDNALDAANRNDRIILEPNSEYSDNRTIDERLTIEGYWEPRTTSPDGITANTTSITGDWTITERGLYQKFTLSGDGSITITGQSVALHKANFRDVDDIVTIDADECMITECWFGNVLFDDGTSEGLVDSCVSLTVVDNGDNTIGDIS